MSNPMFQHRHYAAIADVLADARERVIMGPTPNSTFKTPRDAVEWVEAALGDMFLRDNPNFSRDHFERAARRAPDMHGKDKVA